MWCLFRYSTHAFMDLLIMQCGYCSFRDSRRKGTPFVIFSCPHYIQCVIMPVCDQPWHVAAQRFQLCQSQRDVLSLSTVYNSQNCHTNITLGWSDGLMWVCLRKISVRPHKNILTITQWLTSMSVLFQLNIIYYEEYVNDILRSSYLIKHEKEKKKQWYVVHMTFGNTVLHCMPENLIVGDLLAFQTCVCKHHQVCLELWIVHIPANGTPQNYSMYQLNDDCGT